MKLGSSRGMDTKRPRGSERSKPCHELQLTRRSQPTYPWPPEQAQPGVSKPCRTTQAGHQQRAAVAVLDVGGVDDRVHQQALPIDEDVALPALDLFACIVARRINRRPPFPRS